MSYSLVCGQKQLPWFGYIDRCPDQFGLVISLNTEINVALVYMW